MKKPTPPWNALWISISANTSKVIAMHPTLQHLVKELDRLVSTLEENTSINEPFAIALSDWALPVLTKHDLANSAKTLATDIREHGSDEMGTHEPYLSDYVRRLSYLHTSTIPKLWDNPAAGVSAYLLTLDGLSNALAPALCSKSRANISTPSASARTAKRLQALETKLTEVEPRFGDIFCTIEQMKQVNEVAGRLQTELQALSAERTKLECLMKTAEADCANIARTKVSATACCAELSDREKEAKSILERCQSAYSADTSLGLAAAFSERSTELARSVWMWTAALVVALGVGSYFGAHRVNELSLIIRTTDVPAWIVLTNLCLAFFSVAAPIWFAWLATKQINCRFRLSEDYGFKASVSRAYEGYRREAASHDREMEARLLASALSRFDEQPLRLVQRDDYGTPWHELASSEVVKAAVNSVPGLAEKIRDLAGSASRNPDNEKHTH